MSVTMEDSACPAVRPSSAAAAMPVTDNQLPGQQNWSPSCACAFDKPEENNVVNMPLRLRPGGRLAQALYQKTIIDQRLRQMDKRSWYVPELSQLTPSARSTFVELDCDADTQAFIAEAEDKSEHIFTQLWHSLVKLLLGWFFTQTSLNGFLGRGSMFVFSTPQFSRLLDGHVGQRLLDIGAGDGAVTAQMAPLFQDVAVTEISSPMRKKLESNGYRTLEVHDWGSDGPWDVISCLNVLDRCARPLDLLKQINEHLSPNGTAVLAIVLPYQPYVEIGGKSNHQPEQRIPIQGSSFEEQVGSLIKDVLPQIGFQVERWTRVPYLCEGDLHQAYYWLFDAVFVVKKIPADR